MLHRFPLFLAQTNRKPLFDRSQDLVIQAYENATVGKHVVSVGRLKLKSTLKI